MNEVEQSHIAFKSSPNKNIEAAMATISNCNIKIFMKTDEEYINLETDGKIQEGDVTNNLIKHMVNWHQNRGNIQSLGRDNNQNKPSQNRYNDT